NQAHMSKRTLSRRFAETTGASPLNWISGLRVARAKDLLETTTLSVEQIASECGFGSAPTLRHHFKERVKISPSAYRSRFRLNGDREITGCFPLADESAVDKIAGLIR